MSPGARHLLAMSMIATACGSPPPQTKSQVSVTFRAGFVAEPGVSAAVLVPFPTDGTEAKILEGLLLTDGGSVRLATIFEGTGLSVEGHGSASASFSVEALEALGGDGIPDAGMTLQVADGGTEARYFKVNKGGSSTMKIDFEYTVSRDCGRGCGGKRSWTFSGPVGLSVQEVATTFKEQKTP
jgi:hypothetical protein